MSFNNQNHTENQPLLEEHVETGEERRRASKYIYIFMAVIVCAFTLGAGLCIYISTEGKQELKGFQSHTYAARK